MKYNVKERLMYWMEQEHLSINSVAIQSRINEGKIRRVDNLSCETVCAILEAYPALSAEWLMRGEEHKSDNTLNITQSNTDCVSNGGSTTNHITLTSQQDNKEECVKRLAEYKERLEEYKERIKELKDTILILKGKVIVG